MLKRQLKHDLDTKTVDSLFLAAAQSLLTEFYDEDVNKYESHYTNMRGEKVAFLCDYPGDIVSVNLRFLRHLSTAAQDQLTNEQLDVFQKLVGKIYGDVAIGAD